MTTLWSGRFDIAPDAQALAFGASFRFDRRLLEADVAGSRAWARALAAAGVLVPAEAAQIDAALAAMLEDARTNPGFVDGPDEDVHSFVERLLVERLGDAGRRLHTGRSRNEQVSVVLRLYLRRRILVLQRLLRDVIGALAEQAALASATLMPAFTYFRSELPVLVDLFFVCGDEYRFFELSDALSTGSSMMPQKKNPDPLELVRGKTGRAIGHLMAMLTTLKGLPSGYNKDLQEDKHAVFDAEDTLTGCVAVTRAVVDGLTLNRARAAAAASGLLLAT